ncbi:hypothetical protein ACHAXA_002090 [Cyclostephanos tholiformis]|uniref:Tyrosine specific protein phosphatases domain-containing protein n=1 Tax=Cyclostephanos tholiformis TaxID=382380 RepID=A0ABD3STP4_9STRA
MGRRKYSSARHRLHSIFRDATSLKIRVRSALLSSSSSHQRDVVDASTGWPWLPNRNCGCWYLPPPPPPTHHDECDDFDGMIYDTRMTTTTTTTTGGCLRPSSSCRDLVLPEVYFKSTDGHVGTYAVSLRRINLPLLGLLRDVEEMGRRTDGLLPYDTDVVLRHESTRVEISHRAGGRGGGVDCEPVVDWDTNLHTPHPVVSPEERELMMNVIDSRVQELYGSGVIVDPRRFVDVMKRPVRAIWITNATALSDTSSGVTCDLEKFSIVVCCNPSHHDEDEMARFRRIEIATSDGDDDDNDNDDDDDDEVASGSRWYYYSPGAADDDATWCRNLTPEAFWSNASVLLRPRMTDIDTDRAIDALVGNYGMNGTHRRRADGGECGDVDDRSSSMTGEVSSSSNSDRIGNTNIWIGTRRSGRPPECWDEFDAVLNVTEVEYPNMARSIDHDGGEEGEGSGILRPRGERATRVSRRHYMQLPVMEGKRDKHELERYLPIGIIFIAHHLKRGDRVLVHCAQGRDRSVAIVMAFVAIFCPPSYPLSLRSDFDTLSFDRRTDLPIFDDDDVDDDCLYLKSGLRRVLIDSLLQDGGKDTFMTWMHQQLNVPSTEPFANKDTLRIVLHLVRQDRENAEPTRSTMQKLNRFFMSSNMYRALK